MSDAAEQAAQVVRDRTGGTAWPVAVVLGSGLGAFADGLDEACPIPYAELPGFPLPTVDGHAGRLVLGGVAGTPVAVMQGRAHAYEEGRADAMKGAIRGLAAMGCRRLVLTCAAGSLRPEMGPGSVMLIADHLTLAGVSPLVGERGVGRFVDMVDAYDPVIRARLRAHADGAGLTLDEGIYGWFPGPQFETPAEVRAARTLGADAVGMSTVPEVILARHAGLAVGALAIITNLAAGMGDTGPSHGQTLAAAGDAADAVFALLRAYIAGDGGT